MRKGRKAHGDNMLGDGAHYAVCVDASVFFYSTSLGFELLVNSEQLTSFFRSAVRTTEP